MYTNQSGEYLVYSADSFQQYKYEIGRFPLLTEEAERILAIQISQGNGSARQRLIEANLRLVVYIARKFFNRNQRIPIMDLIQLGNIGLMHAVDKFDYTREVRFTTYAYPWISAPIRLALLEEGYALRVPGYIGTAIHELLQAIHLLSQETGYDPTVEQIMSVVSLPRDMVTELLRLIQPSISMDEKAVSEDSDQERLGTLLEVVDMSIHPDYDILKQELDHEIKHILTNREYFVFTRYYGLYDIEDTPTVIGKNLGISRQTVHVILATCIKKINASPSKEAIFDYLKILCGLQSV